MEFVLTLAYLNWVGPAFFLSIGENCTVANCDTVTNQLKNKSLPVQAFLFFVQKKKLWKKYDTTCLRNTQILKRFRYLITRVLNINPTECEGWGYRAFAANRLVNNNNLSKKNVYSHPIVSVCSEFSYFAIAAAVSLVWWVIFYYVDMIKLYNMPFENWPICKTKAKRAKAGTLPWRGGSCEESEYSD